jgi:hypothetical protein
MRYLELAVSPASLDTEMRLRGNAQAHTAMLESMELITKIFSSIQNLTKILGIVRLGLMMTNTSKPIFDTKTMTVSNLSPVIFLLTAYLVEVMTMSGMVIERYGDARLKRCNAFMTKGSFSTRRME